MTCHKEHTKRARQRYEKATQLKIQGCPSTSSISFNDDAEEYTFTRSSNIL